MIAVIVSSAVPMMQIITSSQFPAYQMYAIYWALMSINILITFVFINAKYVALATLSYHSYVLDTSLQIIARINVDCHLLWHWGHALDMKPQIRIAHWIYAVATNVKTFLFSCSAKSSSG